ncbi:MAG: serine/threonine protein kinase [Candidatus Eremiobacteraeota bacterium]|nr:serine/threonine protein kinase [Candidatus Eremiobacteraeota bacterium]
MPTTSRPIRHAYINASPECWSVFGEVLAREFGNAALFGRVHQLTVDAYLAQHPGGGHPDKSIAIHLAGLFLVLERGLRPHEVAPCLQRLAGRVREWPHFVPPAGRYGVTVFDVALAEGHIAAVEEWARTVWAAWHARYAEIAAFVSTSLGEPIPIRG